MRLEEKILKIEYQVKDGILGVVKSGVKSVSISSAEISASIIA